MRSCLQGSSRVPLWVSTTVVAAHIRLGGGPNVPTSLDQTLLMTGDIDRLLGTASPPIIAGADDGIRVIALGLAGRRDEAHRTLNHMRQSSRIPVFEAWIGYLTAWLDRRPLDMVIGMAALGPLKIQEDPDAIFQQGWLLCDVGQYDGRLGRHRCARYVRATLALRTLSERPQFDALRAYSRSWRCSRRRPPNAITRVRRSGGRGRKASRVVTPSAPAAIDWVGGHA